ncbi:Threonyl-tRNA synthetase (ThrS) (PDB:1NYQ) [Commensalibacter communis]|uniref:Threonine--tRNA ligase n=1 Tax=Commensalibacter communis TaxID=2972786 RepID=A0A9W4TLC1_9PROT|nr:threonine--tRNA ligase [Commensalibacter communis]CAI3924969.1 Threonyl-tRNA synthetase (ThrS) (PDB:1NYQ) [Commensalibacter communis]CAI3926482.1 Threonyl-tRNA synthetase (ThrS) (PDB:1NYQ) [Commensalibacter communis]CAI3935998.1 Threonyl-tRNA synthetase (ThrS) (PDB:1NYQ) [Commensalibacter communis]CAI3936508.1 Threonyl-tRNA synthetase (ThrS) (PDB:1NYQ) [Commensalibacter communis]
MLSITLPDGSIRQYEGTVTGLTIAQSIGAGLAKAALAMEVDGKLVDLSLEITEDSSIKFVTRKDEAALELIRHDAAHILAQAVQELFPGTQVTIGPAIENGFYYDFAREEPFKPEDLENIERRMHEIVTRNEAFIRQVMPRDEAIQYFEKIGEHYKAELIRDLPETETISVYQQGPWLDLCRGPHMRTTADVGGAFKLTKVAGAYWRGDSKNAMLSRIYGTAWRDKKELDAYLTQIEEAAKRDHRRIGKEMDLFHLQEDAAGSIFWHPKGWQLYTNLQNYIQRIQRRYGYVEVRTPQLLDRSLWEASGHWEKFRENMFIATVEDEDRTYALKPMNCPCHIQIFNHTLRSYRELPLRMAEFGACHRYEPSGALHGIMRVRSFVQDDAHIFCSEDQITSETAMFVRMLSEVYKDLGFESFRVKFSDRPEKRAGDDSTWDKAENSLKEACEQVGVEFELNQGEGAFYGPKLEFVLRDAIGRDWQCGTLQVDYVLPERLKASYIGEDSARHRPVMLHRAIVGSFERFLGILIEQYAGSFPLWLAPVQVVVATIVNDAEDYAQEVVELLQSKGMNVELDSRNEKINAKIREHSLQHVPVILVVGRKEVEERKVAIRRLGGAAQEVLGLDEAIELLGKEATPPDYNRAPIVKQKLKLECEG